jgi:hypothetical protein
VLCLEKKSQINNINSYLKKQGKHYQSKKKKGNDKEKNKNKLQDENNRTTNKTKCS